MRLVFRPLVKTDLAEALHCFTDSYWGEPTYRDALAPMWSELIGRDAALAACVEDLDRDFGRSIVAAAIGVMAPPVIASEIAAGRWPRIAIRTLEVWSKRRVPVMGPREIGLGNAGSGLDLAIAHIGVSPEVVQPDGYPVLDRLEPLVHFLSSGFRLRSIRIEVFGEDLLRIGLAMRFRLIARPDESLRGLRAARTGLQPHVVGMSASEAPDFRGTAMASLFTYAPPVLGLTAVERQLLLFALGGITDLEIASLLRVSYATVRKRWDSIYWKVGVSLPQVYGVEPSVDDGSRRGAEKRRRVLRYLQSHPSETRAYASAPGSLPLRRRGATARRGDRS